MEWMLMPLKRYAEFSGRSRRKEYWMYVLFLVVMIVILTYLDIALGLGGEAVGDSYYSDERGAGFSYNVNFGWLTILFLVATLIPNLALSVRRLHDLDKSGWWVLISLIPLVGGLYLLFLYAQPGTAGPNRFGPDPKGDADPKVFA